MISLLLQVCELWGSFGARPASSGARTLLRASTFHQMMALFCFRVFLFTGIFLFCFCFFFLLQQENGLEVLGGNVTNSLKKFLSSI